MATWNTYAEWSEERCRAGIDHLQSQVSAGAVQITGPGGGAQFMTPDSARYSIWEMRCRIAEINGTPRPPPPPKVDKARRRIRWTRPSHDIGY